MMLSISTFNLSCLFLSVGVFSLSINPALSSTQTVIVNTAINPSAAIIPITPIIKARLAAGSPVTIVFFGDSNTAGCGTSDASGAKTFPADIAFALVTNKRQKTSTGDMRWDKDTFAGQAVDATVCRAYQARQVTLKPGVNRNLIVRDGVGGNTSNDLTARFDASITWLSKQSVQKIDLIVIMAGINDSIVQRGIAPTAYANNLQVLIDKIKAAKNSNGQTLIKETLLVTSFSNGSMVAGLPDGQGHPFKVIKDEVACTNAIKSKALYPNTVCDLHLYNQRLAGVADKNKPNVYFLDVAGNILNGLGVHNNTADALAQKNIKRLLAGDDVYHPNDIGYQAIADQIAEHALSLKNNVSPPANLGNLASGIRPTK
ncbi:SGNH/GDSL hydrolase family protein [Undibacterium sp. 10I3]|nr:SGNH/GDSL hydrolase family protein [Undibacterium sp. 10I3]MEB0257269.1 SGNH/GDSL hydrolase family protein [Undibacterium sp. 5I1]